MLKNTNLTRSVIITARSYLQKGLREGKRFQKKLAMFEALEREGEDARQDYQLSALRKIIKHAANNVPYWRTLFNECGVDPNNIKSSEELKNLPLLTKNQVQANLVEFISKKTPKLLLFKGFTSGTTGTPGIFFRDMESIVVENAILWSIRKEAGMMPGCRLAWIRGDLVVPIEKKKPPFWLRNFGENKLIVSSYHLNSKYKNDFLNAIGNFKADGAFAYPSSAYVLSRWCSELGRQLPFHNLHTSSETVLSSQQTLISSVLPGCWADHYGQAERVNIFVSFNGGSYKVFSEYGVTELLQLENGLYEVIGSSLHNFAMPLFRYRTGDIVKGISFKKNERPIIEGLSGRKEDFVKLPDGTILGRLDLIFKGLKNIVEGQIYQPVFDKIVLRIVSSEKYTKEDEKKLLTNARERLGQDIGITVEYHNEIPRSKTGKFKFVVSEVPFS